MEYFSFFFLDKSPITVNVLISMLSDQLQKDLISLAEDGVKGFMKRYTGVLFVKDREEDFLSCKAKVFLYNT